MGKFPAKQLKLCGFLPHPHVNFYFARSPVIHFFLLSFSCHDFTPPLFGFLPS